MTLQTPSYIPQVVFEGPSTRYHWDDWDVKRFYFDADQDLIVQCQGLVDQAVCGLTIAIAEWACFRQRLLDSDPTPLQCIEAAWCANIDRRYSEGLDISRDRWVGPVRGPLRVVMKLLHSTLYEAHEGADVPVEGPSLMSNITEHVCGVTEAFRGWRAKCIARLRQHYIAPEHLNDLFDEQTMKMIVPREIFDPQFPFRPELAGNLVDQFLRRVDFRSNPFLLSPEDMLLEGFEGTPYRYGSTMSR